MGEEAVYIATKIVAAVPMMEGEFLRVVRAHIIDKDDIRQVRDGYRVRDEDGYFSWSPKETFERAYRKITVEETAVILAFGPEVPTPK